MYTTFSRKISVNNGTLFSNFKQEVVEKMAMQLARDIVKSNIVEGIHEFHADYEISVYVATSDDFYKAIKMYSESARYGAPVYIK